MKKKRFLSLLTALVLIVGTLSINVSAAPAQAEVNSEISATVNYLAEQYNGNITVKEYFKVFLMASSGVECSAITQQFLNAVTEDINTNGKLKTLDETPVESPTLYAGVLMALKAANIDATNIAGRNLIIDFSSCLSTYDFSTFNGSPYELVYLMSVLQYYKNDIQNSSTYIESTKNAILSFYQSQSTDDTGFYYYGFSSDTDAKMISALKSFYNTDDNIKTIVDTAIANMKLKANEQYQVDGYGYGCNSDSTGLVLSALSIYGDTSAANYYSGLLGFKSQTAAGAYVYDSSSNVPDPVYSTPDALEGLLSYSRALSGKNSIYDLSVVADKTVITNTSNLDIEITNSSALPAGAKLNISLVENVSTNMSAALNKVSSSYIALDFSLMLEGTLIQPTSPLNITIKVPEGYINPAIYYIDSDGNYQKIDSTVTDGKISFVVTHFSTYAIVNESIASSIASSTALQSTTPQTFDSSPLAFYMIATFASLLTYVVIRKRKVAD